MQPHHDEIDPEKEVKELKSRVKSALSLSEDYNIWEIIEALVMNDSAKLDEMRNRCIQLNSEYTRFIEEIESKNEDRKNVAISSFTRPKK